MIKPNNPEKDRPNLLIRGLEALGRSQAGIPPFALGRRSVMDIDPAAIDARDRKLRKIGQGVRYVALGLGHPGAPLGEHLTDRMLEERRNGGDKTNDHTDYTSILKRIGRGLVLVAEGIGNPGAPLGRHLTDRALAERQVSPQDVDGAIEPSDLPLLDDVIGTPDEPDFREPSE